MKKVKQIKKALPLLLMMVLFVTSVLPAYAAGTDGTGAEPLAETVRYEYNWDDQTEVTYSDYIKVDLDGSATNSITIAEEQLGEELNKYVSLYYGKEEKNASLKVDVSGVDPTKDMVFEVSVRRDTTNSNAPKVYVTLHGEDTNGEAVSQQLLYILSSKFAKVGPTTIASADRVAVKKDGTWSDVGFILKPSGDSGKELEFYIYNAENDKYEMETEVGYSAKFNKLTSIEIYATSDAHDRFLYIDNIKAYNGSEFATGFQSVASIGGVAYYSSFDAAVTAAEKNDVIKLEADVELTASYDYNKAVTYDLNGHTLTGDAFGGNLVKVVDSSNGGGLLVVLQDKLSLVSNNDGYIPVWDTENAGYRFAKVTIEDRNEAIIEDALVFSMRPSFGSDTVEKLVAAGNKTGMVGVHVGVRITWIDPDTQQEKTQDLPLNDSWLSKMYSNPSSPKGVKFTISGGKTITNFTATTIVWSSLSTCPNVEIAGTTHTYQAE